jgi:hypothetical protein
MDLGNRLIDVAVKLEEISEQMTSSGAVATRGLRIYDQAEAVRHLVAELRDAGVLNLWGEVTRHEVT